MLEQTLSEYVASLIKRHPRLSYTAASKQAGLNSNAISDIISGRSMKPTPATLKAIADKWGNGSEFPVLMKLAGHPLPLAVPNNEDPSLQRIVEMIKSKNLSEEELVVLGDALEGIINLTLLGQGDERNILPRGSPKRAKTKATPS